MIVMLSSRWEEEWRDEPYWEVRASKDFDDYPKGTLLFLALVSGTGPDQMHRNRNEIVEKMHYSNFVEGVAGTVDGLGVDLDPDGTCVFTHDYVDVGEYEVVIPAEDVVRALDWRIAIIESDDFHNPDADLPTCEIEVEVRPYSRHRD